MSRVITIAALCVLASFASANTVHHHVPTDGSIHHTGFKFAPSHKPTHAPTWHSKKCVDLPFGHYRTTCSGCALDEACILTCTACVTNEAGILIPQPLTVYSSYSNEMTGTYTLDVSTCETNHVANVDGVLECETDKVVDLLDGVDSGPTDEEQDQATMMFYAIMGFFFIVLLFCCYLNPSKATHNSKATPAADTTVVAAGAAAAAGAGSATTSGAVTAAGKATVTQPTSADINDGGGATGEKLIFDDLFYKFCFWCVPICCHGQERGEVFRERGMAELRSKKLELHLNNKMVVNVAPEYKPSYWSDMFYYVFQKDHFLSCLYCDHEHPFTKKERWMVYFTICCSVVMTATVFRPPTDCHGWLHPHDPLYAQMHTWGRSDMFWTKYCEAGFSPPGMNMMAILLAAVIKVTYGMILEYIAFCPCFADYVGTFKDRTETVGRIILWIAFFFGFYELYIGAMVIMHSPFKIEMVIAIVNSIVVGIITGWITYWAMYHFNRSRQTGFKETCHRCGQGVDQDGDGIECMEVCKSMRNAWNSQKDLAAYDNPDDNDDVAAKNKSKSSKKEKPSQAVAVVDEGSML
jgi:hypothetical protein